MTRASSFLHRLSPSRFLLLAAALVALVAVILFSVGDRAAQAQTTRPSVDFIATTEVLNELERHGIRESEFLYVVIDPPLQTSQDVWVRVDTSSTAVLGQDYNLFMPPVAGQANTYRLRLYAGQSTKGFGVTTTPDFVTEGQEEFRLTLVATENAPYDLVDPDSIEVVILDDSQPIPSTADPNRGLEFGIRRHHVQSGEQVSYYVALASEPSDDVTVTPVKDTPGGAIDLDTGSGMTITPSSLTFTSSNWATPQEFTVSTGDSAPDKYIILHALESDDDDYHSQVNFTGPGVIGRTHVLITVTAGSEVGGGSAEGGAAPPSAVALSLSASSVNEAAGQATLTVTLNAPAPEDGIGGFLFTGEDGTATADVDFTLPFSIFIPGGQRSATATIAITDDDLDEPAETVVLSALFDIGTSLLEDKITLTITDDDTAGVTITAANPLAVTEGGTNTYAVALDSQPTADVSVSATSSDTGAASVAPTSHTFTPAAWNTPATFTVTGVTDTDSNDETVGISHSVTSDDGNYSSLAVSTVRVSVSDTTPPGQQQTPNQAPTVASAIADATFVNQSGTKEVSLSGTFSDADNDALTITAKSSNQAVATVSVAADYSTLTVTAKSRGTATVTVAASDGRGGTVSNVFTVKVKAAPVVASALGDASMEEGDTEDLSLSGVFSDADGDSLTITTVSSDEAKATVTVAADQSTLTVAGVAEGTATITVTAQDSDGNTVSDSFDVSVEPEPEQDPPPESSDGSPTVVQPLPDISLEGAEWREFDLSAAFHDPDGGELTFSAVSSNYGVATTLHVNGTTLTVVATGNGTATITVTAEDPDGNQVSDSFEVTVAPVS